MRRIAIVGSRDYPDMDQVKNYIDRLDRSRVMIISGGARGVDSVAEIHAQTRGIHVAVIRALWNENGKMAGYMRNRIIVELVDEVVAFHWNNSRGTQHTIDIALSESKPVTRITPGSVTP